MRRYLLFLLALPLCAAPTVTVSASAQTLLGSNQSISITLDLVDPNNTGLLRVNGTNIIPIMTASTVTPGATATVGPVYGNDVIRDGFGNLNGTYYRARVFAVINGIISSTAAFQQFFAFTGAGTVDLATATPLAPSFMTGTNGSVSIPGNLSAATINGIINASQQTGADIGAKINTSCALAAGQTVFVPASSAGSFATAIAPALNIPCHIMFDYGTWTYTGTAQFLVYTGNNLIVEGSGSCNGQAAGATCVGGTQFVISNTAANCLDLNGAPGSVLTRFTCVGPNSGTGKGIIVTGNNSAIYDVQVRAFGGDGVTCNGTRGNSNTARWIGLTSFSNKGWGFNLFGANCNDETLFTSGQGNTLGNYQIATSTNYFDAHSDSSGTGTGYTFLSGALGNHGQLYSESGNETTAVNFNSGSASNAVVLTSQAAFVDNGTNNSIDIGPQLLNHNGNAANPGMSFSADKTSGFYSNGAATTVYSAGGVAQFQATTNQLVYGSGFRPCWSSNANPTAAGCDTGIARSAAGLTCADNGFAACTSSFLATDYRLAAARFTSQKTETAADANVLTCAIPAQAGSYRIRFVLNVSAANAATLGWTATWTDSNGTPIASTNLALYSQGIAAPALTFTVSAATDFYGAADVDVNNAGTSIVVKLTFSGTSFTGKASASCERLF